ncbi:MAG: FAD-dependent oxidoreductase [Pseudomonadota bacterium]
MAAPSTFKCDVCGYIHEGEAPPAQCPVCGVGPELFSPFEVASPAPVLTTTPATAPAALWRCQLCGHIHEGPTAPPHCPVCHVGAEMFEPVADVPVAKAPAHRRILVIGSGVAGVTAAEAARRADEGAVITLLGKEPDAPYYRINLTRYLAGEVDEPTLRLKPEDWYNRTRILRQVGEVRRIERATRELVLSDGTVHPYDSLIVASGAHAFVPPISGASRQGVQVCRSLADARQLLAAVSRGSRLVVIGGGLLGLEIAGALNKQGARVQVLEGFGWLLPRQLAEPAGVHLRRYLEGQGLAVRCGAKVEEIVGDEAAHGVRLGDGEVVDCDRVVLAAGVRPNSYLARQAGLAVHNGIVVDDAMRSSDPDIFAAGDVAEHAGLVAGLWPMAYAQGAVAGANAAGAELHYKAVPMSARLKVLDVGLFSIGAFTPPDGSYQVFERDEGSDYLRLVCRDGALVGANLFGDTDMARAIQDAIEKGTQIRELGALTSRVPELLTLCSGVKD